ncbi:L-aminoadipate-semialdehyde dehydrogenase-phosphopantetheinyl transferase [Ctenocephalides felis]|uniref:L-aminoadipate-semialdehyde dehydrogenase-phosphopantetheinyl transferase n=1 Tax=Ctenocephalides felis TaxID=7515 RepID=UPI000E6E3EBB|nr:L-aminoadipate-semialdehyde dehydrogenase-phosphopantetheinyl transferase [Ctenocephalides felis]
MVVSVRWAFNVSSWTPTKMQMQFALSCIQQEEKDRISKYVFGDSFKASLVGRLMLRKFVHVVTGLQYNEIKFRRDDKGKPFLDNSDYQLDVNVSHQGNYAVLAGELGPCKLGVDVMKMEYTTKNRPLAEFFRLMTRHFSPLEWCNIKQGANEQKQTEGFYRHWCLKESYVKNLGCGITVNLQNISFEIQNRTLSEDKVVSDTVCKVNGEYLDGWRFEESLLDEDHCVAVSLYSKGDKPPIKLFEFLNFNDLVKNAVPLLEPDPELCDEFFKKESHPYINN